jgi:hypothetical protein
MNKKRNRNISTIISGGPSLDLISSAERFIYDTPLDDSEAALFDNLEVLSIALESKDISERTALHKILYDLAYYNFYLFLYDDLDWINEYTDFTKYAIDMFHQMNLPVPKEFNRTSIDGILDARDKYRDYFISGLEHFVHSAFSQLWFRKGFLFDFNMRLADEIRPLKKSDYPELAKDGQLQRATYFPVWLKDLIMYRERGLCHYCGCIVATPSIPNQTFDIDHMVPIANGGTNDPTNLVLACPSCNNKKRAKIQSIPDSFFWPERT